ncbi:MAG: PAC2 family protein [Chloroflexi bacterium]|nr:PAC2 family protein [Chloroflexota bacterium]
MKVGVFELREPLPELNKPQALVALAPWIDAGRVGSGVLSFLEEKFHAQDLGRIDKPGVFYDFTRYRPVIYRMEGKREVRIPNTLISYIQGAESHDFVLMHCLEPHMFGETFVESMLAVLEKLHIERYMLLGSMYDSIPHTRPLLVSGSASDEATSATLRRLRVVSSNYQGPTTINTLVSDEAPKRGTETMTMIARLPYYTQLEEDYAGMEVILRLLAHIYKLPLDLSELKKKAEEQYREVGLAVKASSRLREVLQVLEMSYDTQAMKGPEAELPPPLAPNVEKFLREIGEGLP